MEEIWKDIPEYDGIYQISSLGKIRSTARSIYQFGRLVSVETKILKIGQWGKYKHICIRYNTKKRGHFIHKLVALNFIPNPDNKPEVNHIDGDKHNNQASNLEWCTRLENEQHAKRIGLKFHLRGLQVLDLSSGFVYPSIREFCKTKNINRVLATRNFKLNLFTDYILV